MDILSQNEVCLDDFISSFQNKSLEKITKNLIALDKKIYQERDKDRFIYIKQSTRKIISSLGMFDLTRRYYFDNVENKYIYLLDNCYGLPKNTPFTNEIRIKILSLVTKLSYEEVGKQVCPNYIISKVSIYRIVKDTIINSIDEDFEKYSKPKFRVHIQIDEKYEPVNKKAKYKRYEKRKSVNERKLRYITATIFAGKKRGKLLNKTIVSSFSRKELINNINYLLINKYKQNENDTVYLSGDLAKYIRESAFMIKPCKAIYIPDLWHVLRYINSTSIKVNKNMLINNADSVFKLIDPTSNEQVKSVYNLYTEDSDCFKRWNFNDYLGCSQECMNSHYYSPRFAKIGNRFSKANFIKLITIIESSVNNTQIKIVSKKHDIQEVVDFRPWLTYDDIEKLSLDTRGMHYNTAKMFNKIKFGY